MTITFRNVPALTGAATADVPTLSMADFRVQDRVRSDDGLSRESVHVYNTGLTTIDTRLIVRHVYVPKTDQTRVSVRLITPVEDDSLADDPVLGDYETGIFWNFPGERCVDNTQLARMIHATLAAVTGTYSTGAPSHTALLRLNRGITDTPWT